MPGERISVKVEFATPPIEGIYFMVWQIMKKDGTPAFPKNMKRCRITIRQVVSRETFGLVTVKILNSYDA